MTSFGKVAAFRENLHNACVDEIQDVFVILKDPRGADSSFKKIIKACIEKEK